MTSFCLRFRWVSLQMQNVCDSPRLKLPEDVEEELEKLPWILKELYDVIYEKIIDSGPRSRRLAERMIPLPLCAKTHLGPNSLVDGITLDNSSYPISVRDVLDICCNLVVLDENLDTFRFAHLSAREYLEGLSIYARANIEHEAFQACIGLF